MKRSIYLITLLAFIMRMGLGISAFILLPQTGYESKTQQAGYLFLDAYRRDTQAWDLAQSSKPLSRAFEQKFSSDQYGGLLWISAFVYRYLAAGTHQPLLIVFLSALTGSVGVLFVFFTSKRLITPQRRSASMETPVRFPLSSRYSHGKKIGGKSIHPLRTQIMSTSAPQKPVSTSAPQKPVSTSTAESNDITRSINPRLSVLQTLLPALIFAFFPEAILLGASQMREPFLMTFIAMVFYGLTDWAERASVLWVSRKKNAGAWFWILFALAGMLFMSPGFVVVTLVASAGWLYFADPLGVETTQASPEAHVEHKIPGQVIVGALLLFVLALVVVTISWTSLVTASGGGFFGVIGSWAQATARWNAYLLGRSSGIVQLLFQALPPTLAMPFVAVYGVLQPVLPAVIFEPSIPFWQTLGIFRALGWYLLLPLLAFAPIAAGILPAGQRRKQWLWLSLVVWVWIFIAALRGGGDQWDNPRYRVILLPWIALLAGMAFKQLPIFYHPAHSGENLKKNLLPALISTPASLRRRWFWRICGVEAIILLVFGHWYSWRYVGFGFNLGIRNTIAIAIGLSVLVVLGDWLWYNARPWLQRFRPSSRL